MAIGGESIGRAYVKILADGSDFSDDVRRELSKAEDEFGKGGRRTGKIQQEAYEKEMLKGQGQTLRKLQMQLLKSKGKFRAQGAQMGGSVVDGIESELSKFGDIGKKAFALLAKDFQEGKIDLTGMVDSLDDLRPLFAKAEKAILAEQKKIQSEVDQASRAAAAQRQKRAAEALREQARLEKESVRISRERFDNLRYDMERLSKQIDSSSTARRRFRRELQDIEHGLPLVGDGARRLITDVQRLGDSIGRSERPLGSLHRTLDRTGEGIGKAFGRGARNDFVNFFGSFVSLLPRAGAGLAKLLGTISALPGEFTKLAEATGGVGPAIASLFGKVLTVGIPALIGLVAMLAAVGTAVGVFATAISLAAGAVLALAGSLGFALVGGIVAAGGALVPLAAAFGVAMIAMSQFQQKAKNKEFQKFVKGLKEDWKGLQETVAKRVFGKDMGGLTALSGVLKSIRPLILPVADALGGLLKQFGKFAQTKGFTNLMKGLGDALGPMVTQLGQIAGKLGLGLAKAFIVAGPYITQFLGWLEGVTDALINASKGGEKSKLAGFLSEAADSAQILWDLITNVGDVILNLFTAGKGQGDSMLQGLADAAADLNKWLSDPANHDTIQGWFIDARNFGEKLGTIVEDVGKLIGKLDTPTNRTILFKLLDIADSLILAIGNASDAVEELATDPAFKNILDNIQKMLDGMDLAGEGKDISIGIDAREGGMDKLFGGIVAAAQTADDSITKWITDHRPDWKAIFAPLTTGDPFATLRQRSGEAWAGIQATWGVVSGFFSGIWTSVSTNVQTALTTIKTRLSELPGQIVQAFTSLPANIWTFVQQMIAPFVWLYNYLVGASLIPDLVNAIVGWFARLPGLISGALGDIAGRFQIWLAGVPQKIQSSVGLVAGAFAGLAGKAITRAGSIVSAFAKWVAGLPGKARVIATSVAAGFTNLAGKIISKAGSLASRFASWVSSLAGKARSTAVSIVSAFGNLAGKIISKAGSIASKFGSWVAGLPGKAKTIAGNIASAFSGLAGKIITRAGDIASKFAAWGAKAVTSAGRVATNIVHKFSGLASDIVNAIGNIVPKIKMPSIKVPTVIAKVIVPKKAAGGIVNGAQLAMIGEAGPEAIVPLSRSLARVDPAVRALSAFAQGMTPPGATAGPSIGRQIDVGGITINTPTSDPRAVASEVVARMTYAAYI